MSVAREQVSGLRRIRSELEAQVALAESRLRAGGADQLEVQSARLELAGTEQILAEAENQATVAADLLEAALQIPLTNLGVLAPAARSPTVTVFKKSP